MNPHLRSLKAKRADLAAQLKGIDAAAGEEPMTAEQMEQFDSLSAEVAAVNDRIAQAEKVEAITKAASVETAKPATATPGLEVVKENAEDRPWSEANDPKEGFANFLLAVHKADPRVSGDADPRLFKHAGPSGSNEGVGSEGGFLVGTDQTTELNKIMFESAMLANRCQPVKIGKNSNSMSTRMINETSRAAGSRWGGVQVYWASEGGTVTAKKPSFRLVDQKLGKLMGIWYCTEEELEDADYLASVSANAFGEEMSFVLDDAIYREDGAGKPLGILASPALVTVSKETGQAGATIEYQNLVKMFSRIPPRSLLRSAWFINPDCMPQLLTMVMEIGTGGRPVYLPPNGAADAPFGTILGRPVVPNEHSSTVGTVGDIVLADLGWYRLITKGGVRAASSIHVRFIYDESAFRFTYRVNGQPMINSAITPAQGTNTVSPFVALETRS